MEAFDRPTGLPRWFGSALEPQLRPDLTPSEAGRLVVGTHTHTLLEVEANSKHDRPRNGEISLNSKQMMTRSTPTYLAGRAKQAVTFSLKSSIASLLIPVWCMCPRISACTSCARRDTPARTYGVPLLRTYSCVRAPSDRAHYTTYTLPASNFKTQQGTDGITPTMPPSLSLLPILFPSRHFPYRAMLLCT